MMRLLALTFILFLFIGCGGEGGSGSSSVVQGATDEPALETPPAVPDIS